MQLHSDEKPRLTIFLASALVVLTYLVFRTSLPAFPHLLAYNLIIILSFQELGFYQSLYALSGAVILTLLLSLGKSFDYVWHVPLFFITFLVVDNEIKKFQYHRHIIETRIEEIKENTNILTDAYGRHIRESEALKKKEERYNLLKDVTAQFNSTLSREELGSKILENAFRVVGKSDTGILSLVDTKKQELNLYTTLFRAEPEKIEAKKGDGLDEWVFRQRHCLLVEDVRKDFRFTPETFDAYKRQFRSVIACPLIESHKVTGILRLESARPYAFNSEDLHILDIIADLSAVSLQNTLLYKQTLDLAITDSLTGLYLRGYFLERAEEELTRCVREGGECSLLMLDIDDFKLYNDEFGHTAGDRVLQKLAHDIKAGCEGGISCRYGGEEFAVLVPWVSKKKAVTLADEIRRAIKREPVVLRRQKTFVSVSVGVVSFPDDGRAMDELIAKADEALYRAKREGKDRTRA